jgi:tRNA threonylcarbamoyladenosine biosynthesis protein TsaE
VASRRATPSGHLTFDSRSEEETRRAGECCGRHVVTPMVFSLIGGLGSGKTMFVQGLARGLGVPEGFYVTSPSFTLVNEYPGRLPLSHIDLYRLEAGLDLYDLGLVEVMKSDGVAAVEWADKLPPGTFSDTLEIRFEIGDGDRRTLRFSAYGQDASSLLKSFDLSARRVRDPGPDPKER